MKFFFLFLFFTYTLFSASIDTRLYDANASVSYFDEIKQQIDLSLLTQKKDKKSVQNELTNLARVRESFNQKIAIESYNIKGFDTQTISLQSYYEAITQLSQFKNQKEINSKILSEVELQIPFLKKTIKNITKDDKDKLLSYQLQFAYYKIQEKNVKLKISLLEKEILKITESLVLSYDKLVCTTENMQTQESSSLLDKKLVLGGVEYEDFLEKRISSQLMHSICLLKNKNINGFSTLIKSIETLIESLDEKTQQSLFMFELDTVQYLSKSELSRTQRIFNSTVEESRDLFHTLKEFFFSPLFVFNEQSISLFSISKALVYIIIGFFLGVFYKKWIAKITSKWDDVSMMSVRLISNIGYYLIILIFLIISISSLGIDMSSLSLIAGALSIGIGFGLQTVVSNFIAGLILMFERTIRIGDIIEINEVLSGVVTDMRIRSTTIKTYDNIDIVVPNSSFIQNNVINMTLEDRVKRLHIPFSVAYGTEIEDVREAVLTALEKSELIYIRNNEDRKASIRMTLMNSSSVDLELIVWVHRDVKLKNISIESDFLILIYDTLRNNNIEIPFPQLDVYMKQMLEDTKHE